MKKLLCILILSLTSSFVFASEFLDLSKEDLTNEEIYLLEDLNKADRTRVPVCSASGVFYGRFVRTIGVGTYKRQAARRALRKCIDTGASKCRINECWLQRRRRQ